MRFKHFITLLVVTAAGCTASRQINTTSDIQKDNNFLFLSDIHLDTLQTTKYGDDTGLQLWNNFLQKAERILAGPNPPKFAIYTGDLPAHYSCRSNCALRPGDTVTATHNHNLTVILSGLRQLMAKYHVPFFFLPGNNDAIAGNYFSFSNAAQQSAFGLVPDPSNPYPALNINSDSTTAPCVLSLAHINKGYYSARPLPGLRLVCMNTVIYSYKYSPVDGGTVSGDRNDEMQWLKNELQDAQQKQEKVYIAMHIPPGTDAYSGNPMWEKTPGNYLKQFLALLSDYQQNIEGIFFGHTHMDELRRFYNNAGRITAVGISCPGVTPQHDNNPGFKTVYYDRKTLAPLNFITHYTTPDALNWGDSSYSFRQVFGQKAGTTVFQQLAGMSFADISARMQSIYSVRYLPVSYNSGAGIEVK